MKTKISCPTEDEEQIALMQWAAVMSGRYPELRLMYHIPNGGARSKPEAARFKAMGVKKGVPDICLPVARGIFHGLYIELKRQRGGRESNEQKQWIEALRGQGYAAAVCKGWRQAASTIEIYLEGGSIYVQDVPAVAPCEK